MFIRSLLEELSEFTKKNKDLEDDKDMETTPSQSSKGYIQDRQVFSLFMLSRLMVKCVNTLAS